ncbi:MAG: hypothetical protein K2X60_11775 [Xanthobacteraceae bacterium]|nr:hypothetical protein [Xanthobacteraceae bacterium]
MGIWLSYGRAKDALKRRLAGEMLARALKCFTNFCLKWSAKYRQQNIATAALDQPGDEGALIAEKRPVGNA